MRLALLLPATLLALSPVAAQDGGQSGGQAGGQAGGFLSKLGGSGGLGGLGSNLGGLGGMVPGLGSAGSGNIAGLLGYCLKNQLLGGVAGTGAGTGATAAAPAATGAAGLLGKLTGKPGVATSPGFLSGQQGVLQTGGGGLSLDSLGGGIKQKLCGQVLSRAKALIGR